MNKIKYLMIVGVMALFVNAAFGQSGELGRFSNEKLEVKNQVRMFPNPSVDILQVRIDNSDLGKVSLTVYNIIGNVMEVKVQQIANNHFNIKVNDLDPGYYLLAIREEKNKIKKTYKFLVRS